ncbi:metal ABC transporter permease [Microlunatus speluncae]|uniref:metal ABC transporter permease n=1 Tax=Microlunatus speluncae TaxID=2594267 RepID=UPI0012668644|nr:metal ABC transporter permease [Microlunatus speluncae]
MGFWELLITPLGYDFMVHALITTVVASIVCALLSCWLIMAGWSLMGDAVSHAVLPGVVLAYIGGFPYVIGALIFGLGAVVLIGVVRQRTRVREDAAIGIVFTTLFAIGMVLISVTPSQTDLNHILFGSVLGLSRGDVIQVGVVALLAAAWMIFKRRDLTLYVFDPGHAQAIGLRPGRMRWTLLIALALTVVVAIQAVGVIMVVAMLITPGAAAFCLTRRFGLMLVLAPVIAAGCALIGLYGSYYLDLSPGGSVVVCQGAAFAVAALVGGLRRHAARSRLAADPVAVAR